MSDPVASLARAEAAAILAREHLHVTLGVLQARLEPKRLARDAARDLSGAGGAAARRTAQVARRNPGALAGAIALAGLFLARRRVVALFRRRKATAARGAS